MNVEQQNDLILLKIWSLNEWAATSTVGSAGPDRQGRAALCRAKSGYQLHIPFIF